MSSGGNHPYEPTAEPPGPYAPRAPAPGHRIGRAEGATVRLEPFQSAYVSQTVLAFRLVDPATGRQQEVELRGRAMAGTVHDGDWVEVAGEPGRSGRLEVVTVSNLTTGSVVTASSPRGAAHKVFLFAAAAIVALALLGIVLIMLAFALNS